MPSAPQWLRNKFPGDDLEAFAVLEENFIELAGCFWRKDLNYTPTLREEEALDYMFYEWDYSYEPRS